MREGSVYNVPFLRSQEALLPIAGAVCTLRSELNLPQVLNLREVRDVQESLLPALAEEKQRLIQHAGTYMEKIGQLATGSVKVRVLP